MTALFWLQVALEISGAILFFRRRLSILYAYCGFSAAADLFAYAIQDVHPLYGWFTWSAEGIQYAIMAILACKLAGLMFRESWFIMRYSFLLCFLVGGLTGFAAAQADTWAGKFLDAEAAASLALVTAVGLAWLAKKKDLEGVWRLVLAGLMVACVGNALLSALSTEWPLGLSLYPIPAILALLVWNLSVLPRKPKESVPLEEARLPVPPKFEPTSVGRSELASQRIQ